MREIRRTTRDTIEYLGVLSFIGYIVIRQDKKHKKVFFHFLCFFPYIISTLLVILRFLKAAIPPRDSLECAPGAS